MARLVAYSANRFRFCTVRCPPQKMGLSQRPAVGGAINLRSDCTRACPTDGWGRSATRNTAHCKSFRMVARVPARCRSDRWPVRKEDTASGICVSAWASKSTASSIYVTPLPRPDSGHRSWEIHFTTNRLARSPHCHSDSRKYPFSDSRVRADWKQVADCGRVSHGYGMPRSSRKAGVEMGATTSLRFFHSSSTAAYIRWTAAMAFIRSTWVAELITSPVCW